MTRAYGAASSPIKTLQDVANPGYRLGDIQRAPVQPVPVASWQKCDGTVLPYSDKLSQILSPQPAAGFTGSIAGDYFGSSSFNAQPQAFCTGLDKTIILWNNQDYYLYASDGSLTTNSYLNSSAQERMIACAWSKLNGVFVALGNLQNIYKSTDGITWTAVAKPAVVSFLLAVGCDTNGRIILMGYKSTGVGTFHYTDDLTTWTNFLTDFASNLNGEPANASVEGIRGTDGNIYVVLRIPFGGGTYSNWSMLGYPATQASLPAGYNWANGDSNQYVFKSINGVLWYTYIDGSNSRIATTYDPATKVGGLFNYKDAVFPSNPMTIGKFATLDGSKEQLILTIDTIGTGVIRTILSDDGVSFRALNIGQPRAYRSWGDKRGYYIVHLNGQGYRFQTALQVPTVLDRDPINDFYLKVA